ncbi:hypothetical protein [Streptomyces mangrovisoli]|uniref:Uncharacterized protein n=1 Tax=Streptomyces mangrovisoli TaxID=1428628 RepID=A0A1J4NP47_9ACTN|nr:hypothetical protein [Streptomyces mangrovisoli]OIJ64083.1 hypothetical protein WN71_030600 [Streptomyces mangrovisoli]
MPTAPPAPGIPQAQAAPAAPGQPGATVPGRLSVWFSRIRPDQQSAKAAAAAALSALGCQLGLLFLLIAIAAQFLPDENSGTVGDWMTAAVWVAALALRGTLGLSVEGGGDSGSSDGLGGLVSGAVSGQAEIDLTLQMLTLTCTALFAVWWFARSAERRAAVDTWARVAGRSATGALVYAAVLSVLALATHSSSVFGMKTEELGSVSVDLGVGLWPLLPYAAVFVFLADFAARAGVRRTVLGALPGGFTGRLHQWRSPFLAAGTASAILLGLAALTALGLALFGDTDEMGAGASFALVLLVLVNFAVWLAGLAMGVTVGNSLNGSAGVHSFFGGDDTSQLKETKAGLFSGNMPGAAYLLLLAVALVVIVAAVRHALAHDPRERMLSGLWRFAAAMAVLWTPLAVMSGLDMAVDGDVSVGEGFFGGSGSAHGSVSAGLSVFGALLVALLWGGLLLAAAQFLTRPVLSAFPAAAAWVLRIPGLPVHPQWAALLADAAHRKGRPVPPRLMSALTEPLACPPLATDAKWARFTGVGLIIAVVVGGGGTAAWAVVDSQVYGPEAAAEDYLQAVADGRADDALELQGGPTSGRLLTKAALDTQRRAAPLTDVSVEKVDESGTSATATVSYKVDGKKYESELRLITGDDDKHLGLWRRWKVVDGLAQVEVTASPLLHEAKVNGVQVPLQDGSAELTVFPGTVTVEGVDSGYVAADGGGSVVVGPGDTGSPDSLDAALTSAGEQAAQEAVNTALTQCAQSTDLEPDDCPLSPDSHYSYFYSSDVAEDVQWSQQSQPELQTEMAEDGTVTASGNLDFKVNWVNVDSYEGDKTKEKDTCTASFSATVDFSGDTPSVTFYSGYGD